MNIIVKISGILKFINKIFYIIGGVSLVSLFILMSSDVLGRFLFDSPINGATELGEYFIAALAFFGLAYAQQTGRTITVDTFSEHFPKKLLNIVIIIGFVLSAIFFAVMAYETGQVAYKDMIGKVLKPNTTFLAPVWLISFIASLGCILLVITFTLQTFERLFGLGRGEKQE
jgi:TRAP-type transport system small permease protein